MSMGARWRRLVRVPMGFAVGVNTTASVAAMMGVHVALAWVPVAPSSKVGHAIVHVARRGTGG